MGSRDLSVITTPPPTASRGHRSHLYDERIIREAIEYELARNGQVYFVHNRIETIGEIEAMIRGLPPRPAPPSDTDAWTPGRWKT